jgi:hypothetical protein
MREEARHQWLTPVIPATQEAEFGRIMGKEFTQETHLQNYQSKWTEVVERLLCKCEVMSSNPVTFKSAKP